MVGREERNRNLGCYLPPLCRIPKGSVQCAAGTRVPQCRYPALEGEPLAHDADAKDQAAAQASSSAGFYDQERSGKVPVVCSLNSTPGSVLFDWVVHWK